MSFEKHDDECPGCRPVLLNHQTGVPLPEDSPQMQAVKSVWDQTTIAERQAFHRFCCQNSRTEEDTKVVASISRSVELALSLLSLPNKIQVH